MAVNWPVPSAQPKTYQDVKSTLRFFTIWLLIVVGLLVYFLELPPSHRKAVGHLFGLISRSSGLVGGGVVVAFALFLGWLLVFQLEVHDKFWDRFVVHWRHYYALDFIIPRLYRPFQASLNARFFDRADGETPSFMRPFYVFVGDGDDEFRISQNVRTRFYERVTKYWVAQITEVVFVVLLVTSLVYTPYYYAAHLPTGRLLSFVLIVAIVLLLNSLYARAVLVGVREATEDEIREIHGDAKRSAELERWTRTLHESLGLPYGPGH